MSSDASHGVYVSPTVKYVADKSFLRANNIMNKNISQNVTKFIIHCCDQRCFADNYTSVSVLSFRMSRE